MLIDEEKYLMHYGILRKSGRYPWGSGANPYQRSKSFLDVVADLREKGLTDAEIARGFSTENHPFTTTDLRQATSLARAQKKQGDIAQAVKLKMDKQLSNVEIGKLMGIPESSVRNLLKASEKEQVDILKGVSDMLRSRVDETGGFIQIGTGIENHLGISSTRLSTAVSILKAEGYEVHKVQVNQLGTGPGNKTTIKVLTPPGTTYRDVVTQMDKIQLPMVRSDNHGRTFSKTLPPLQLDSKRVKINYAEDGGDQADGTIYVRPGVPDLSLGNSRYAQVRIAVDGTHYIKGMAVYKDDLPAGTDILFNTNKTKGTPMLGPKDNTVLKPIKDDESNPFGAIYDQIGERDASGRLTKVTSVMNVLREEGDVFKWTKTLSSQVLSKQSPVLAKTQLDLTYARKKEELDEIMALTNPVVKKKLLEAYADGADASAVHLKAAALPKQLNQVIMPVPSMKDNEIYAPNFQNGERVALIRYPHGGTFEIPELIVNNKHSAAKALLGDAVDAVGINANVAARMSGADFDGDTVLVIPNPITNPKLKTQAPLAGLKDFDPQRDYKLPPGEKFKGNMQNEMGVVSNLITDMTIKRANTTDLAAAVRHSMVVIDAEKHDLDLKRSYEENGIANLKKKYQAKPDGTYGGSSTLISRATSEVRVPHRKRTYKIDEATGKKIYTYTGEGYYDSKGKWIPRTTKSVKLAETDDANTLSSGTPIERVYADHSNRMKALANQARKESLRTGAIPYSPTARKYYEKDLADLDLELDRALRNRPLERQAQLIANAHVSVKRQANPGLEKDQIKKIESQALAEARARMGAGKKNITLTPRQWEAIQAGAIRTNKLETILNNADLDEIKKLATPKTKLLMSPAKTSQAKRMAALGYTQAEIASHLGVSLTTLKEGLK